MTTDHGSCTSCPHWVRPALWVLVLSVAAAALGAEGQEPLGVYVVPKKPESDSPPSKEDLKRAKQSLAEAKKAIQQLTDRLRREHGKEWAKWPEDQRELVRAAANTYGDPAFIVFYDKPNKQEDVDDSTENLKTTIEGKGLFHGKKESIRIVSTAEDAHLMVEVVARKKVGLSGPYVTRYIAVKVSAGGRLAPGVLAKLELGGAAKGTANPFDHWGGFSVYHFPTPEKPFAVFESSSTHYWSTTAGVLGKHLATLIDSNYALLSGQ